jgi:hypothetical protein
MDYKSKILNYACLFRIYNELNKNLTDYISTVTDKEDISKIPIESINDFLNGLESFLEESASN